MAGNRRHSDRRRFPLGMAMVTALLFSASWVYIRITEPLHEESYKEILLPALTSDRPEVVPDGPPRPGVSEKGDDDRTISNSAAISEPKESPAALIAAGKQALARDDILSARVHFSEAMRRGVDEPDASFLRAELTRIGQQTIFSQRLVSGDPLVERHVIQPGDTLDKIARQRKISADLLAEINNIADKNKIRGGQTIKIVRGPFHAVIDRKSFNLDVYLGSTLVRHYKVGIGADDSTPAGEWRVSTKLVNPTYYPPRGGAIIAADDPQNPLGERWIGLEGVGGEALGQLRYGIHGTIEPQSIGQSTSLGCIRLYNEDVVALYTYLVERHSTVTIR